MNKDQTLLRDRLAMSYVRRWVINPTFRESNVAEHTFRVLCIARFILDYLISEGASRRVETLYLLLDVMDHDADEVHTGDMPSTDKYKDGIVPSIIDPLTRVRKVADRIETYSYWVHWGNHFTPVPHNPLQNSQGQWETKCVLKYTEDWPELREAAASVLEVLGCHMNGVSH